MPKAAKKSNTPAQIRTTDDDRLIELASQLADLRTKKMAAISNYLRLEHAAHEAKRAADAIEEKMACAYERVLALAPTTPEGQRALAQAVVIQAEHSPEIDTPESDTERGTVALLTAIAGPLDGILTY